MIKSICITCIGIIVLSSAFVRSGKALEKWTPFKNIEQVEYCLQLPLTGLSENFKENDVRGRHVFSNKLKANRQTTLTAWGMLRSENSNAETYMSTYYSDAEENGKVIEKRKLDKAGNKFYGWGYWSNSIYESRFVEIFWLRDGELVKLEASFPVSDTSLWKTRVDKLFKQTSACK